MKSLPLGLMILSMLAAGPQLHAGAIVQGTVKLPEASAIPPAKGRYQPKSGVVGKPSASVAIVYIEGAFPQGTTNQAKRVVTMGQKDFQFQPGALVVQKGTTVLFPNLDDDYHNVFSYSKPKKFDLGRYRKEESPPGQLFEQAGLIKLYCEIHEHMRGNILVVDTPFFHRTDEAGGFKIENVPAGKFKVKAWLDEKTILEQEIVVEDGKTHELSFGTN